MQTTKRKDYISSQKSVVALGNFDGVHLGHAELIKAAVSCARENGFLSCIYTFADHPSNFKDDIRALITDNDEKNEIIAGLGADVICYDDFSEVKGYSCSDFCNDILVKKLACEIAVCGKNYCFGKEKSGNCETLVSEMQKLGKKVIVIDDVKLSGELVNSTFIRKLICAGDVEKAAICLGRRFSVTAQVVHGKQLGRLLDAPTINQLFPEKKITPKNGVYICTCHVDGKEYPGVANIGTAPTVTEEKNAKTVCETHIIGFSGDLYGKNIKLEFCRRLRDEKKFSSIDELKKEIAHNIAQAKEYFEKETGVLK